MKKILLSLVLFVLLFQGCELFVTEEPLGSIHAIYVALNYHGTDVTYLEGTLNDGTELDACLESLCNRHRRTYRSYPLMQRGGELLERSKARLIYAYDDPSAYSSLPTKNNVLEQIEALKPLLTEKDLTIFSFSGHGLEGGSLVLAPPSADNPTIFTLERNVKEGVLLSVGELLSALSALPGKQLLILDSCYCGSFVKGSGSSVSLIEKDTFLEEAFATYFSLERYNPSLFVLAATTGNNTSKEPRNTGHIHGYFTEALLDGLGWDHTAYSAKERTPAMIKGVLTLDSLYRHVLENQKIASKGLNPRQYQHPTTTGGAYTLRLF